MSKGKQKQAKNSKLAAEKRTISVNNPHNDNINEWHNSRKEALGPNTDR